MSSEAEELKREVAAPPAGWRTAPFSALADYVNGRAFKPEDWGTVGLPIIRIAQITNPNAETNFFDGEVDPRNLIDTDDLIFSWSATLAVMRWNKGPAILNQHLFKVTPNEGVDRNWLRYRLEASIPNLADEAHGTTMKHIRKGTLSSKTTVVPPLDEQRRIAEVLRSVDEAIAANRAALDQVARARSAILHTAFEEPRWEVVPLGELGSWQSGGTPSKDDETKWGGDVPWVCPRDMKTPVIRQTHSTLTPIALGGSCKLVPKGTLMIVVRGMILAKAIPTATTAMDATFNQDMKAFRPNGRALPKFVQLCLQHQERQLLRVVNTATHGTKKLDTDTLLAVSVPLPDLETQQAVATAVSDLDFASVKYGEEHIRLSTMKQALMSDLLSGHVRVPA